MGIILFLENKLFYHKLITKSIKINIEYGKRMWKMLLSD